MSDRHLRPVSALAGIAVPGRFGKAEGEPGVVISERVGLALATVACRKGQADSLKAAIANVYGVELPDSSRAAKGPKVGFVGTGPGQWLAMSEGLGAEALARDLAQRLAGLASISDQSGGRTVIRVSGPRARDVLAKGLPIDLDPRAFPLGSAATSVIALMGVQLWQTEDTRSYDIAMFRSVSQSFWRWLTASSAEFGYEVAA
ncbi:MAG: sarcosine oxidase subunit gamma [Methyloceanibacter sp.]|nr:sarcosine oxidase subunit gamma [Methyloceanibacter sp.]